MTLNARVPAFELVPVVAIDPSIEQRLKRRRLNKRLYDERRKCRQVVKQPVSPRQPVLQTPPSDREYPSLEFPEEAGDLAEDEADAFEASAPEGPRDEERDSLSFPSTQIETTQPQDPAQLLHLCAELEDFPPLDPCLEFGYSFVDNNVLILDA